MKIFLFRSYISKNADEIVPGDLKDPDRDQ